MTDIREHRPWYLTFHDLMPYRVREILLLSSPYDAFTLEEDGRVTEKIFTEYSELNLSTAPRITHVSSGARAMQLLAERRFDLVVTMLRVADTNVSGFAREVKKEYPRMPVVLLVLTEADLQQLPGGVDQDVIDRIFVWTGDARILLSIIKLVEDMKNVEHDSHTAGVRVIILVEDSARRYSSFLTLLYEELMAQSESLVAEGVNELHRLMRMRTRPKILLATTFEEAMRVYESFPEHVVAVVSDIRFPRNGEEDPEAGFALLQAIRAHDPELPVLLESADPDAGRKAVSLGASYIDKASPSFQRELRQFVNESLGFGDFVFRMPDRTEVGRARDMYELEQIIRTVPASSIEYHATRNHFSTWLMARSMFELSALLKPQRMESLGGVEGVRRHLLRLLKQERIREQEGVITDFSPRRTGAESHFVRLTKGSIGGKARGLAFFTSLIAREGYTHRFAELDIRTPRSVLVGSDEFDRFVESNHILDSLEAGTSDRQILSRCLAGHLSEGLTYDLRRGIAGIRGPVAVRSSSLLEDSQLQPFAGIYATYMLPNNHPDPEVRFSELCQAIKAVYASTFSEDARAYIAGTPYRLEEEKMAVVVQEMVGRAYGERFYPTLSGVALSYNYYPFAHQKAEDGIVLLALGLGHQVVRGGTALQFSPADPGILPQYSSAQEFLRYSQKGFYALDLSKRVQSFVGDESFLVHCELEQAEADGTLGSVASVYSREDDVLRDNLTLPGPRVVTFNNILRWGAIPLAPALRELLHVAKESLGCPVEMEFAVDVPAPAHNREGRAPVLHVLQVRPQATQLLDAAVDLDHHDEDEVLCRTDRSLGHGVYEEVRDVVYVKRADLDPRETPVVARQVGDINSRLLASRTPYLLIGPGRWGSSDPRLGVPVKWAQIAGAKLIIETAFADRDVEPSQGAHFFHNVTSFRIGYMTLGERLEEGKRFLDRAWLESQPAVFETAEVRHLRLETPLRARLDGRKGAAVVLKPKPA